MWNRLSGQGCHFRGYLGVQKLGKARVIMLGGPWQPLDNHTYRAILVEASRCTAASAAAPPPSQSLGPARRPRGARACEPRGGPRPEAEGCSAGLEAAVASRGAQVRWLDRPGLRFSLSRRRCQGDRRRTFPQWAPPPGQSYQRLPEYRFSLFRSHYRPRTGGIAASAERLRPLGWCGTG